MTRNTTMFLLALAATFGLSQGGRAEETVVPSPTPTKEMSPLPDNKTKEWIQKLREKLAKWEKKKGLAAVAAVRGAKQESHSELYWKKTTKQISPTQKELDAFHNALKTLEEGKKDEAAAAFESFLITYPKSQFSEDARSTLEMLKEITPVTAQSTHL